MIRKEASSGPGIFFRTLRFHYVFSSPGFPLLHLHGRHRVLQERVTSNTASKLITLLGLECLYLFCGDKAHTERIVVYQIKPHLKQVIIQNSIRNSIYVI